MKNVWKLNYAILKHYTNLYNALYKCFSRFKNDKWHNVVFHLCVFLWYNIRLFSTYFMFYKIKNEIQSFLYHNFPHVYIIHVICSIRYIYIYFEAIILSKKTETIRSFLCTIKIVSINIILYSSMATPICDHILQFRR